MFDADENDDGVRNGIEEKPSTAAVVSDYIDSVYLSSNIWAEQGTTETAATLIAQWIVVNVVEGEEDNIASVACIEVPAVIADVADMRWSDSLGVPEADYPTERTYWSDNGYNLYKTTSGNWIVSIRPNAIMSVGDVFGIRATYTDESYEDFFVSTSFIIEGWAKVSTYGEEPLLDTEGTSLNAATFTGETLAFVFTKPVGDDGEVLTGLTYSVSYGIADCSGEGGRCGVPADTEEKPATSETDTTFTYTLTTDGDAGTTYYVLPVASAPTGDQRNGAETWFEKE